MVLFCVTCAMWRRGILSALQVYCPSRWCDDGGGNIIEEGQTNWLPIAQFISIMKIKFPRCLIILLIDQVVSFEWPNSKNCVIRVGFMGTDYSSREVDEDVWIGNKIIEVWRKFDAHCYVLMEKLTKDFNFDSWSVWSTTGDRYNRNIKELLPAICPSVNLTWELIQDMAEHECLIVL